MHMIMVKWIIWCINIIESVYFSACALILSAKACECVFPFTFVTCPIIIIYIRCACCAVVNKPPSHSFYKLLLLFIATAITIYTNGEACYGVAHETNAMHRALYGICIQLEHRTWYTMHHVNDGYMHLALLFSS